MQAGEIPIYEPELETLFQRNRAANRLNFSSDLAEAVAFAELIFLALPTPELEDGGADLSYVLQVSKEIAALATELFWEAHLVGRDKEYCHMEQLVNLDELPHEGFKVAVFPLKIVGASAAPARVVAIFD